MDLILLVFVGLLCLMLGVRVYCAEERNRIFNKRSIVVKDEKKYNRICGGLIIGFGVVAEITLYFMFQSEGWLGSLLTIAIIVEAFVLVAIYNQVERKCIKR